jgi:hypothetical protein
MKSNWVVLGALAVLGCGASGESDVAEQGASGVAVSALGTKDFDVDFSDCAEFAGIGLVPAGNARPLVPAHYELAVVGSDAIMVVRVARCGGAVIDGKQRGATTTSQVGISVVGQDETAFINNYTVFYATDQAVLHARLKSAGLDADHTNSLSFALAGGTLGIASSSAHTPSFELTGSAATPTNPPTVFIASWWADGNHGVFRQRTVFPEIRFSDSSMTLTTPAGSALASLVGGTSYTFALLDSYNTFAAAHLEVRDTD